MWMLECDGDLFDHKRKWLKPGQKYLFGRTKGDAQPGEQFHTINNKSVSRKHLVIAVESVKKGEGGHVHEKSKLTVTDESKLGTHIDGDKLLQETRTLSEKLHTIKLGSYDQAFRISWHPVVFTFSYTLKEQQRFDDILAPFREKLEPLDIKTILTYSIFDTTHVVTSKRNIPKCLQALVNAKYIVKETFIDALIGWCTSARVSEDGKTPLPSPLEEDFDLNWPDPLLYLPDAGKEPVARPSDLFAPDPERINLFEGFTFVFADAAQYEQLSPVLTNGGAKAVKYELKLGESSLADFVQFIRNVAGQKGIKDLAANDSGKKVVVVRFRGKGNTEQWALDFVQNLDSELGLRSVEQNEFLDAILMNDSSPLYRQLEDDDVVQGGRETRSSNASAEKQANGSNPSDETGQGEIQQQQSTMEAKAAEIVSPQSENKPTTARTRFRRPIPESRFKGFDEFDPSQLNKSNKGRRDSVDEENNNDSQPQNDRSAMEVDSQPLFVSDSQPGAQYKKRPAPDDEDAGAEMFENLLPAAAAMKRRRLEDQRTGRITPSTDRSEDASTQQKLATKPAAAKKRKELDVRTEARSHAQKLDQERSPRPSEPRGDAGANDPEEDISQLRNLVLIEDMPLRARNRTPHSQATQNGGAGAERWDARWNGLKNFKKFRRHGERGVPAANRGRKTLVGLEEVRPKDFGIGEDYWLEPSASSKREKRGRHARGQTQTQTQGGRVEAAEQQEEELLPEEVAGEPREGPVADALAAVQQKQQEQRQSQADTAPTQGRGKGKRAAPVSKAPPAKRQRQPARSATQAVRDESSDEDELKFRLRRRKG